jgi:hypothetical protein
VVEPRKFCPRCVQGRPRCDLCRAPVSEGAQPLSDGQYRCTLCAAHLVRAVAGVQAVYRDVVSDMARVLHEQLQTPPHLRVVSRREMGEIRRRYERRTADEAAAASHHVLGYFVQANGVSTIYVEQFLPRGLLLGTLAHELAHAWQTEHALNLNDPLLREGFAEWVAYRILMERNLAALAERATRRDDLYGRGLRHFLNTENRFGYTGVMKRARGQST